MHTTEHIAETVAVELLGWREKGEEIYGVTTWRSDNDTLEWLPKTDTEWWVFAGRIIEALRSRGIRTEILMSHDFKYQAYVGVDRKYAGANILPEAVLRAAAAALEK